jgi:hypothetical protein
MCLKKYQNHSGGMASVKKLKKRREGKVKKIAKE